MSREDLLFNKDKIEHRFAEKMAPYQNTMSIKKIDEYFTSGRFVNDIKDIMNEGFEDIFNELNNNENPENIAEYLQEMYEGDEGKIKDFLPEIKAKQGDKLKEELYEFLDILDKAENGSEAEKKKINEYYSKWINVDKHSVKIKLDEYDIEVILKRDFWLILNDRKSGKVDKRLMLDPKQLMVLRRVLKIVEPFISREVEEGEPWKRFRKLYKKLYKRIRKKCGVYGARIIEQDHKKSGFEIEEELEELAKISEIVKNSKMGDYEFFDSLNAKDIRDTFLNNDQELLEAGESPAFNLEIQIDDLSEDNFEYFLDNIDDLTLGQVLAVMDKLKEQIQDYRVKNITGIMFFLEEQVQKELPVSLLDKIIEIYEKVHAVLSDGNFKVKEVLEAYHSTEGEEDVDVKSKFKEMLAAEGIGEQLSSAELDNIMEQNLEQVYKTYSPQEEIEDIEIPEELKLLDPQEEKEIIDKVLEKWDYEKELTELVEKHDLSLYNENIDEDVDNLQNDLIEAIYSKVDKVFEEHNEQNNKE